VGLVGDDFLGETRLLRKSVQVDERATRPRRPANVDHDPDRMATAECETAPSRLISIGALSGK
jgi:hypothetical protein